ncbi:MAG: FHA domain-containing protein [Fimbriimonadales bacterium]
MDSDPIEEPVIEPEDTSSPSPAAELRPVRADATERFAIAERAVIGRFDPGVGPIDVDLGSLPEGVYISRKHAEIWHEDGVWYIKDLDSSNGTFLLRHGDFARIDEESEIADGQEIAFGNARFSFHTLSTPAPALEVVPEDISAGESVDPDDA